jgi:hypothetical protein
MSSRRTKKRPLSIVVVSTIYMMAPILMPLQSVFYDTGPGTDWVKLATSPSLNAILVMAFSVVVGVGIFTVRPWGFALFLAHAIGILANNVYIASNVPGYPLWLTLVSNAAVLSVAGYFVWSNVRAPYFNPKARLWEQAQRVKASLDATVRVGQTELACQTVDFSETGAFLACATESLDVGTRYPVTLHLSGRVLKMDAEVVWKSSEPTGSLPAGVGIRFVQLPVEERDFLRSLIRRLSAGESIFVAEA